MLNCKDVTPAALLAPHARAVAERCAGHACVAVSQDTTELDYSQMKETGGLGPLNEEYRRGFFMHSLYVVSEDGLPLGVFERPSGGPRVPWCGVRRARRSRHSHPSSCHTRQADE